MAIEIEKRKHGSGGYFTVHIFETRIETNSRSQRFISFLETINFHVVYTAGCCCCCLNSISFSQILSPPFASWNGKIGIGERGRFIAVSRSVSPFDVCYCFSLTRLRTSTRDSLSLSLLVALIIAVACAFGDPVVLHIHVLSPTALLDSFIHPNFEMEN